MTNNEYQLLSEIVGEIRNDNSNAFAELYSLTYEKQYYIAFKYLRDEYLAQDALQELYILVLKNINKLRDPKLLISWMNHINYRVCFKLAQKAKSQQAELNNTDLELCEDTYSAHSLDQCITRKDTRRELLQKIEKLPPFEKEAILMKYYNDMSVSNIGEVLDCSDRTVKRYLSNGRKKLLEMIKEEGGNINDYQL